MLQGKPKVENRHHRKLVLISLLIHSPNKYLLTAHSGPVSVKAKDRDNCLGGRGGVHKV